MSEAELKEDEHKPAKYKILKSAFEFDDYMSKIDIEAPVLIQFTAMWCRKCTSLKQEVAKNFDEHLQWVSVDIDEAFELQERFSVTKLPRFDVFFGGRATTLESFEATIENLRPLLRVEKRPPLILDNDDF